MYKGMELIHYDSFMNLCHRKKALSMWKNRLGSGATYRALIEAFHNAGRVDLAKFVCELIGDIGDTDGMTQSLSHMQRLS